MTDFNPQKYGFKNTAGEDPYGVHVYETSDFRLSFKTLNDGFLILYDTSGDIISMGKIPATNQSLALLLKAFAIQRPKT